MKSLHLQIIVTRSFVVQRFNVAVTRAKALLIVVGNPRILETDSTWARHVTHSYFRFQQTLNFKLGFKFERVICADFLVHSFSVRLQLHPVLQR